MRPCRPEVLQPARSGIGTVMVRHIRKYGFPQLLGKAIIAGIHLPAFLVVGRRADNDHRFTAFSVHHIVIDVFHDNLQSVSIIFICHPGVFVVPASVDQNQDVILPAAVIAVRQVDVHILLNFITAVCKQLLAVAYPLHAPRMQAGFIVFRRQQAVMDFGLRAAAADAVMKTVAHRASADRAFPAVRIMVFVRAYHPAAAADSV